MRSEQDDDGDDYYATGCRQTREKYCLHHI
jgi:hypothetical protein